MAKAESSGSKQEAYRWGGGMLNRCARKNAGRGPGRGHISNRSLPGWPASRGLEGRAAGDWERWDLRLQERRGQYEGAQVEGDRCTRKASGYSRDWEGFFTETHNTLRTLSPPHH